MLFAETYEELMQRGQFYERLGWFLAALSFVILIGGIVFSEWLKRKKAKNTNQEPEKPPRPPK